MRWVIARVFPVPAPARTQTGPVRASATSRWSGSRASRISSADIAVILAAPTDTRRRARSAGGPAPGSIGRWMRHGSSPRFVETIWRQADSMGSHSCSKDPHESRGPVTARSRHGHHVLHRFVRVLPEAQDLPPVSYTHL